MRARPSSGFPEIVPGACWSPAQPTTSIQGCQVLAVTPLFLPRSLAAAQDPSSLLLCALHWIGSPTGLEIWSSIEILEHSTVQANVLPLMAIMRHISLRPGCFYLCGLAAPYELQSGQRTASSNSWIPVTFLQSRTELIFHFLLKLPGHAQSLPFSPRVSSRLTWYVSSPKDNLGPKMWKWPQSWLNSISPATSYISKLPQ